MQDQLLQTIPWCPEVQGEMALPKTEDNRPNCILSVTTKLSLAPLDTTERNPALLKIAHSLSRTG